MMVHQEAYSNVVAQLSQAGRVLRMARESFANNGLRDDGINALLDSVKGGEKGVDAMILKLNRAYERAAGDPRKVNKALTEELNKIDKITATDMFVEYWYNSLLSGATTQMINVTSNFATQIMKPG